VLTTYEIVATDAGSAIAVATQRGHNDGFSHVSIQAVHQLASNRWAIDVFLANSQMVTRRV
jgi:hypothetical protein